MLPVPLGGEPGCAGGAIGKGPTVLAGPFVAFYDAPRRPLSAILSNVGTDALTAISP